MHQHTDAKKSARRTTILTATILLLVVAAAPSVAAAHPTADVTCGYLSGCMLTAGGVQPGDKIGGWNDDNLPSGHMWEVTDASGTILYNECVTTLGNPADPSTYSTGTYTVLPTQVGQPLIINWYDTCIPCIVEVAPVITCSPSRSDELPVEPKDPET